MMYRKIVYLLLITLTWFNFSTKIYADTNSKKNSLIVYETKEVFESNINSVNHLNQLLYVFNENVDTVSIDDYKSNNINNFDYIFVININNDITNRDFLKDLSEFNNKIYWIGDKIENFLDFSNKYDVSYDSKNNNITKLSYKNKEFLINENYPFNILNTSTTTNIIASMNDGYNNYPFILIDKNLYYISRWDPEVSYIFEDSLNDFYERKNFEKEEIFIRIEDVHPFSDTNKLREIADYLYKENVSFMISIIPTYTDTRTGNIETLDLKPEFIDTIKYMQIKGGSVVLNGYSYQIDNEQITYEGYEFWEIENKISINEDINTYIKNRVLSGLRLCIENEIYPLAFKAPYDAMNIDGYKEIQKYFSTYVGRYKSNSDNFINTTFPYIIKDSSLFNVLIPENLGYINSDDKFTIDIMKDNFNKLSMVRGYSGGFFFYQDTDIKYLKECVEFLKDNNVNFLDLKQKENYIKIDDITINSKDGNITCSYDKSKSISMKKEKSKFETQIRSINNIVISFVSIILLLFLIIFIIFKVMNKRKFTRR